MINYLVLPLLLVLAVFQSSAAPQLAVWGVFPNLPLVFVLCLSLLWGVRSGLVWGFVAGVLLDLVSGSPFGAAALSLMAVSLISGWGQASVHRGHILVLLFAGLLATLVYGLVFLVVVRTAGNRVAWLDSLVRTILPTAALDALLVPIVYLILGRLHRRLGREAMGF